MRIPSSICLRMTLRSNSHKQATKVTGKTIVFSIENKNLKMEWLMIFRLRAMTSLLTKSSNRAKMTTTKKLRMLCSRTYSAMSLKICPRLNARNNKPKTRRCWLKGSSVCKPTPLISQIYLGLFWRKCQWWCAHLKSKSLQEWSWKLESSKTWSTHISIS